MLKWFSSSFITFSMQKYPILYENMHKSRLKSTKINYNCFFHSFFGPAYDSNEHFRIPDDLTIW